MLLGGSLHYWFIKQVKRLDKFFVKFDKAKAEKIISKGQENKDFEQKYRLDRFKKVLNLESSWFANVICFTTGRGSCFGCKPVPSLKLSTNSAMFERMSEDMDINCGTIAEGKEREIW